MLSLFCVVDGKPLSKCFKIDIVPTAYVDDLRDAIKAKYDLEFSDVRATDITLWRVSIPGVAPDMNKSISLADSAVQQQLAPISRLSDVFVEAVPEGMIHIIVQVPDAAQIPAPVHTLSRQPSVSPPASMSLEDFHAAIKKIAAKFLATGTPEGGYLNKFVLGEGTLPVTTGPVSGLPQVRRLKERKPADTRPSLLFLDLPGPSTDDATSEQLTSGRILDLVETCGTQTVPVFGVSGCGKTRGLIELLSQHWGFYFNASADDLGSEDMSTLMNDIELLPKQNRHANNVHARKMTYLLILARLLIFQRCLKVTNSGQTFTCARWALFQICPQIFIFSDVFDDLFRRILRLPWEALEEPTMCTIVKDEFDATKACLVEHEGLPRFQSTTRLFVVLDEAQILGDKHPRSFVSTSDNKTDRPLLSPILHGFRSARSTSNLSLITSGTGLSIYILDWVRSSGSFPKGSIGKFPYMEFPGWTDRASVKDYIKRLRNALPKKEAKDALDRLIPPAAIDMMMKRLVGRFRPIVRAIESIIERGEPSAWQSAIEEVETQLTSWDYSEEPGNLCYEFLRLEDKYNKNPATLRKFTSVREELELFFFERYAYGANSHTPDVVMPELVECAFGRIKMVDGTVRTVLDEPFALKAAENYFRVRNSGFVKTTKFWARLSNNQQMRGYIWEVMMMNVFIETFKTQSLDSWLVVPSISYQCEALNGKTKIVGLNEPDEQDEPDEPNEQKEKKELDKLEKRVFHCGITHEYISLKAFMHAHVNNNSMLDGHPVPPFFIPARNISGPDIVFYIRVNGKLFPVFVQLKFHVTMSSALARSALDSVSAECLKKHVDIEILRDACPTDKTYISMLIVYPATIKVSLDTRRDTGLEDFTQVLVKVDGSNFGKIFPQDHVKLLDYLKSTEKRPAEDVQAESSYKKTRI